MSALRDILPTRRVEAWKYSDLRAALRDRPLPDHAPRPGEDVIAQLAPSIDAHRIERDALIVERLERSGLDARASRFEVAAGATLTRIVVQTGSGAPLSTCKVALAEGATLRQFILALGADLARLETEVQVAGQGAQVELFGIYLATAGRHADLTSRVTHEAPNGTTHQLVKGAVRAGGRGVFQGKIVVAEAAQHTDARQTHRALMLEEGGEIDAKPELEIYADDVACAHGNTIGALDEDALFYMRQRGIPDAQARALLIEAFLMDAAPAWLPADAAEEVTTIVRTWLGGAP